MDRTDELERRQALREAAKRRAHHLREQALDDAWRRVRAWLSFPIGRTAAPVPAA